MNKLILTIIFTTVFAYGTFAQNPAQKPESKDSSLYMQLVEKIRSGDNTVNFGSLRRAYVAWLNTGSNSDEHPKRKEMVKAFESKDYKKAVELAEIVIAAEFINSGLLGAMADAYKQIGDEKKFKFYDDLKHKARHGLFLSGDGKTAKTAYYVMSIPEEYRVMRELGFTTSMQSLLSIDGQSFDLLKGTDEKGNSVEVFFNICAFFPCSSVK